MAPFTARSPSSASSILTTLDGGVARGYAGIPQVERAIAVHLCPRNAATWRNRPRLLSKACKLTAALAAKAYSAAGQAASALHAMAILQVHQAKALKQVHEASTEPGLMQELRTATDFALRETKVMARSLRKAMSIMVVQERHLGLNLAEMKDVDKARFLDASISQGGLFGETADGFAQQFSAVQQQTEAIQHILPRRDAPSTAAPGARPQSARRRSAPGRIDTLAGASSLSQESGAPPHPSQAPSRPGSRRSGPDAANPEMLEFALSLRRRREQRRSFPWWRAGRRIFCFCSAAGPRARVPTSQERAISLSSGFSGPWADSVRCPASSLSPTAHFASSQESTVRGRHSSPCTSGQSRLGPREFGEDASERTAFCTIHPTRFRCTTTGMSIVPLEPLAQRLEAWLTLPSLSRWLTRTIRLGYAIQFTRQLPKFNGVLEMSVAVRNAPVLREEIAVLLAKDAIEPVPPAERRQGFYSPYFIVPKKRGGLRPILDLQVLNRALHKLPFKMRTRRRII